MLLDEIIATLSDEKGSLTSALLKTKVLLHSIGKKDLANWVTHELKGYPDEDSVPEYRRISAEVHGHVESIAWRMADTKLPIMHLKDEQRKYLTSMACTMSISSIEESVRGYRSESSQKLIRHLPPEFGGLFRKVLEPGVNVISAWCEINMIQVEGILTEVRSRLLDFALELRDVVGPDTPEKELVEKVANVDTEKMFATAVYGSGNTIIVGSHSFQSINNQKDDIEGLVAAIGQLGLQQPMLLELREAVQQDQKAGNEPNVADGKTGQWFSKALQEAGKGIVQTGVDIVSTVIVKALKAYTGTP
ncbi:MAG: hypothetical protein IPJ27_08020 [Candidatus Accumulibacter sp.]|uniref:AbiTii domain-containing protein n=1 Tax=Candidatus Accumulibacter proximus TaxID=2954385 RepID=A0A935UGQ9_9PROT|nr:hypothetical protein [Candidatus Accumulibacter proximus]